MRILIAPDKFKGSLSAAGVAGAMERGIKAVFPDAECLLFPMADGGEGFLEVIGNYLPLQIREVPATDPLGRPLQAVYGWEEATRTAIIELAGTAGLQLLRKEAYDPLNSSTAGTGLVIRAAWEAGAKKIMLGLGGSATTDAGTGILQSLGFRFLDQEGQELNACGANLQYIQKILVPEQIPDIRFLVAADVENPLYGPQGAAVVFAPQKGAGAEMVLELDQGLQQYAAVIKSEFGKDIAFVPGTGAAGGILASLLTFFEVEQQPGAALIMELSRLPEQIKGVSLIITGEGQLDAQTLKGKLVARLAEAGKQNNVPVLAVCGKLKDPEQAAALPLQAILPLVQGTTTEAEAMNATAVLIEKELTNYFRDKY